MTERTVREMLETEAIYSKWTKPQLADWLIAHGTVYPNRSGLLKWSKRDLLSSVTDRVLEAPAYQIAAQNREANWPEAATATPPEFPFKLDRFVYGPEALR